MNLEMFSKYQMNELGEEMGEENNLLELIEKKLDRALLPMNPEDDYLSNLNSKLFSQQRISIEKGDYFRAILLVSFAFVTGISILLIIRGLFSSSKKSR